MDKTSNISTLTTIGIDRQTGKLIDKLCKRYSLKKGDRYRRLERTNKYKNATFVAWMQEIDLSA